jgi:microcystin-dependent protein
VGTETETLTTAQMANHTHNMKGLGPSNTNVPTGATMATIPTVFQYHASTNLVNAAPAAVADNGSGESHNNMQPFLPLAFIIAIQGLYPSRN